MSQNKCNLVNSDFLFNLKVLFPEKLKFFIESFVLKPYFIDDVIIFLSKDKKLAF